MQLESLTSVEVAPLNGPGLRKLPPEIEKLESTAYAGHPAEYPDQSVMLFENKEVIVMHYFIGRGVYMVADKVDRPGIVPAYPVSPDQLRRIEETKH